MEKNVFYNRLCDSIMNNERLQKSFGFEFMALFYTYRQIILKSQIYTTCPRKQGTLYHLLLCKYFSILFIVIKLDY